MDELRFDRLTRRVVGMTSRRTLLGSAAVAGWAGLEAVTDQAQAKGKKGGNDRGKGTGKDKALCRANGSSCKKKNNTCAAANCLKAPLTIEALWSTDSDHDTYLFVPAENGSSDPFPYVDYTCTPEDSDCDAKSYPFVCVSEDATGPGDEITTVRKLFSGKYEYWIELDSGIPAGELNVILRNANGRVVRSWRNPAAPGNDQLGWHVFDLVVSAKKTTVVSIDTVIGDSLPEGAYPENTFVCAV